MTMPTSEETRDSQVSVRISEAMTRWLERRAGTEGSKAEVVRTLIEEEMEREERQRLRAMFDAAAEELTDEEREDRDRLVGAFSPEDG